MLEVRDAPQSVRNTERLTAPSDRRDLNLGVMPHPTSGVHLLETKPSCPLSLNTCLILGFVGELEEALAAFTCLLQVVMC